MENSRRALKNGVDGLRQKAWRSQQLGQTGVSHQQLEQKDGKISWVWQGQQSTGKWKQLGLCAGVIGHGVGLEVVLLAVVMGWVALMLK